MRFEDERGNSYLIGTKMFPVASKSALKSFNSENTEAFQHEQLSNIINNHKFENGQCYLNADIVLQVCQALKIDAKFYAGWVFFTVSGMPVHHAWVVIDGKHVIDTSVSLPELEILSRIDTSNPNWRYIAKDKIRALPKVPNTESRVFGHVPSSFQYVGSPDKPDNARAIFRHLRSVFPQHPSYAYRGADMKDRSELQKMLLED